MITVICTDGQRRRFFRNKTRTFPDHIGWVCRECGKRFEDLPFRIIRPKLVEHICIKKLATK